MKIRYLDGPRPYNAFLAGGDTVIQDPYGISREMGNDYAELLVHSLQSARESLKDTPKKLSLLAKADVVDAESSGRVSRMKGFLANALNLKPIVSVDVDGKGTTAGKSFSRRGNMKKILRMITKSATEKPVRSYAIVHARDPERAGVYAEKQAAILGRQPVYTMSASPVIGVHVGAGLVAIALTYE